MNAKTIENEKMVDKILINHDFTYQTMMTCIGNKRKLVNEIVDFIDKIRIDLNKEKLNILDGFTGSTVISRALSSVCSKLYTNDIELYSYLMAKCYLEKPSKVNQGKIKNHIDKMNSLAQNGPYIEGIISMNYAPKDTNNIKYPAGTCLLKKAKPRRIIEIQI